MPPAVRNGIGIASHPRSLHDPGPPLPRRSLRGGRTQWSQTCARSSSCPMLASSSNETLKQTDDGPIVRPARRSGRLSVGRRDRPAAPRHLAAPHLCLDAGAGADPLQRLHPDPGRAHRHRIVVRLRPHLADLGIRRHRQFRPRRQRSGLLAVAPQQPDHRLRLDHPADRHRHDARGDPRPRHPPRLDLLPHHHLRADGDLGGGRRPDLADDPRPQYRSAQRAS